MASTLSRRYAPSMQRVLLVTALLVLAVASSARAAIFIGASGTAWTGNCAQTCTSNTPCTLGATITLTNVPCDVTFASGLTVPATTISYTASPASSLTLRTAGAVSLTNGMTLRLGSSSLVFNGFTASTSGTVSITAGSVSMTGMQVNLAAGATSLLWDISGATTLSIASSTFTATTAFIRVQTTAVATAISMSQVTVNNALGLINTVSGPFTQSDFTVTDCIFTNSLSFATSKFKTTTFTNVTGTMPAVGSIFAYSPTNFNCDLCTFSSPGPSRLSNTDQVTPVGLSIKNSAWTNVGISYAKLGTAVFDTVTVTMDNQQYSALDLSAGVDSITVSNTKIQSLASSGTNLKPLVSIQPNSPASLTISNVNWQMIQAPNTAAPSIKLGVGRYSFSNAQTFGSALLSKGNTIFYISGITWTGDISDDGTGVCTWYIRGVGGDQDGNVAIAASSMKVGNVVFNTYSAPASMTYTVTNPTQGISCTSASGCFNIQPAADPVELVWDRTTSIGLPTIGVDYPFVQGTANQYGFLPSSNEYSVWTSPVGAAFNFRAVPCPSSCVVANSGPCVSRNVCSCKSGFIGTNCECPTGGCPPPTPIQPPPTPIPTAPAPVTPPPTPVPLAPAPVQIAPTPVPVIAPTPVPIAPTPVPIAPTPVPIAPTPVPIAPTPVPIAPTPVPIAPAPIPLPPTPAPVVPTPVPTAPAPAPTAPAPAPTPPTPSPIAEEPHPIAGNPSPISSTPTPSPTAPTPTPTPASPPSPISTPSPAPTAPNPARSPLPAPSPYVFVPSPVRAPIQPNVPSISPRPAPFQNTHPSSASGIALSSLAAIVALLAFLLL